MTLWETKTFLCQSGELLTAEEDSALKFSLAMDPESGDLIPNTGGARKLRWAIGARPATSRRCRRFQDFPRQISEICPLFAGWPPL